MASAKFAILILKATVHMRNQVELALMVPWVCGAIKLTWRPNAHTASICFANNVSGHGILHPKTVRRSRVTMACFAPRSKVFWIKTATKTLWYKNNEESRLNRHQALQRRQQKLQRRQLLNDQSQKCAPNADTVLRCMNEATSAIMSRAKHASTVFVTVVSFHNFRDVNVLYFATNCVIAHRALHASTNEVVKLAKTTHAQLTASHRIICFLHKK
jgi:hypothetical protein